MSVIPTTNFDQKGGANNKYIMYATVTLNSQTVSECKSNVTIKLTAKSTDSDYGAYDTAGNGSSPVTLTVDGSSKINKTMKMDFRNKATVTLGTWTGDIVHSRTTGKKDITFTASFYVDGSSSLGKSNKITMTKTVTLRTIDLASTIGTVTSSSDTFYIGSTFTIPVTIRNSDFTHKMTISINDTIVSTISNVTSSTKVDTSSSSTIEKWCKALPNSDSGTAAITLNTYSGSTKVGTTKTASFKVNITLDSKATPTFSKDAEITDTSEGYNKCGAYVQNVSNLNIKLYPSAKYGATIKKCSVTFCGKTMSTTGTTITQKVTQSGNLMMVMKILDSRGFESSTTKTLKVLEYNQPTISSFTVSRCNSDGTINQNGACLKPIISYKASTLTNNSENKNDLTIEFHYKRNGATSYSFEQWTPTTFSGSTSNVITSTSTENSYTCYVVIEDAFYMIESGIASVGTTFSLLHLSDDGTGIAIGKIANTANTFDVNLSSIFRKSINIYGTYNLVFSGTNSYQGIEFKNSAYENNSSSSSTYQHYCILRGNNAGSSTAIELRDIKNNRSVFTYDDVDNQIYFSSRLLYGQRSLWSGTLWPTDKQTASFSEPVTKQTNGIILVFSRYDTDNKKALDDNFICRYIPKWLVNNQGGKGYTMVLFSRTLSKISVKYIYISNDKLTGHADNTASGTSGSGLAYQNNYFCLRYVIGI